MDGTILIEGFAGADCDGGGRGRITPGGGASFQRFSGSASCVIKLVQRWGATGSVEPGQMGGWKAHSLAEHEAVVRTLIAKRWDLTLEELRDELAERGIFVLAAHRWIGS